MWVFATYAAAAELVARWIGRALFVVFVVAAFFYCWR